MLTSEGERVVVGAAPIRGCDGGKGEGGREGASAAEGDHGEYEHSLKGMEHR